MKHFFLIIVLALVGYVAYEMASPIERRHASRLITRHGLRIAAILLVIFGLLAAAFYLPTSIIF